MLHRAVSQLLGLSSRLNPRSGSMAGNIILAATSCALFSCRGSSSGEPEIRGLEPPVSSRGRVATALVRGQNFHRRVRLDLDRRRTAVVEQDFEVWLGTHQLLPDSIELVDSETLLIELPTSLPVGWYELRLKTPADKWASLRDALEVVETASAVGGAGGTSSSAEGLSGGVSSGSSEPDAGQGQGGALRSVLSTSGRTLLDTCGRPLVIRGVEQSLADGLPADNNWMGIVDEIAEGGANAVRLHPHSSLENVDVVSVLTRVQERGLIGFLRPESTDWFTQAGVKDLLAPFADHIVLDAFYPEYDDRGRFVTEAKTAVEQLRAHGYQVPLFVMSNKYGRDLPALLNSGAEILAADPLTNVIFGWTAYWGDSNWYQGQYNMTLSSALEVSGSASFPIQLGFTHRADVDPNDDFMDYASAMTAAQEQGLGWMWWNWYSPASPFNSLSEDGTNENLRALGQEVMATHASSIGATAASACVGD